LDYINYNIKEILIRVLTIIPALIIHEVSHGFAAYLLGDKTAKRDGRLSLNPLRHLDPIGTFLIIFFRFGWAKPVMVNPYRMKNPKQDMALTAAAGPLSNFLFAFVTVLVFVPICGGIPKISYLDLFLSGYAALNFKLFILAFLEMLFIINIVLGIFNMIPIPPLDGSKVMSAFLPPSLYFKYINFKYGFVILVLFVFTGMTSRILEPFINMVYSGFMFLADKIYFFL